MYSPVCVGPGQKPLVRNHVVAHMSKKALSVMEVTKFVMLSIQYFKIITFDSLVGREMYRGFFFIFGV